MLFVSCRAKFQIGVFFFFYEYNIKILHIKYEEKIGVYININVPDSIKASQLNVFGRK